MPSKKKPASSSKVDKQKPVILSKELGPSVTVLNKQEIPVQAKDESDSEESADYEDEEFESDSD